ncbi:MAG: hypothetical protein DHS20C17_26210 [Cyclobacteriaceae bacterium]|nr:MAG: hypothetical protein DHS20C17_26210 [Cyclobacteriaceae bacterium]
MDLLEATIKKLSNVSHYLQIIDKKVYTKPIDILSNSSIGEHTRHILEFYQCLLVQNERGSVNYDLRDRNQLLQSEPAFALKVLSEIMNSLPNQYLNRPINLEISYDQDQTNPAVVVTSLERELVYNLEHVIHHLAIIKIGLSIVAPQMVLPNGFGVAVSTMRFKQNACAQ